MAARGNRNNLSPDWTEAELAILSAYADPELPLRAVVARLPGRTYRATQCKAHVTGISARRRWRRAEQVMASLRTSSDFAFNLSPGELDEWAGHRR